MWIGHWEPTHHLLSFPLQGAVPSPPLFAVEGELSAQSPVPVLGDHGRKSVTSSMVDLGWRAYVQVHEALMRFSQLDWDPDARFGQLRSTLWRIFFMHLRKGICLMNQWMSCF